MIESWNNFFSIKTSFKETHNRRSFFWSKLHQKGSLTNFRETFSLSIIYIHLCSNKYWGAVRQYDPHAVRLYNSEGTGVLNANPVVLALIATEDKYCETSTSISSVFRIYMYVTYECMSPVICNNLDQYYLNETSI